MVADALALRWQVTQNDDDFHNARTALEALDPEQHWQTLASLLIDHGDYDDANSVLARPLESEDVVARLLTVDAHLRTGKTDLARELLLALPATTTRKHGITATCASERTPPTLH